MPTQEGLLHAEDRFAAIDFETTGFSPAKGDRAIEVAAVLVEGGRVSDCYHTLINPARPIPSFVQELTGISNSMVEAAPSAAFAMRQVYDFVGNMKLVAHYASFDRRFWEFECTAAGLMVEREWVCTRNLCRRVYPWDGGYRLATLAERFGLPIRRSHRALDDARVTASLFLKIQEGLETVNATRAGVQGRGWGEAPSWYKELFHKRSSGCSIPSLSSARSQHVVEQTPRDKPYRLFSAPSTTMGIPAPPITGPRIPIAVLQHLRPAAPRPARRQGYRSRRHPGDTSPLESTPDTRSTSSLATQDETAPGWLGEP